MLELPNEAVEEVLTGSGYIKHYSFSTSSDESLAPRVSAMISSSKKLDNEGGSRRKRESTVCIETDIFSKCAVHNKTSSVNECGSILNNGLPVPKNHKLVKFRASLPEKCSGLVNSGKRNSIRNRLTGSRGRIEFLSKQLPLAEHNSLLAATPLSSRTPSPPWNRSTSVVDPHDILLRRFEKHPTPLSSDDLVLDNSRGVTEVVDPARVLGLESVPLCKGYLLKRQKQTLALRQKRFVVLDNCSLSWYKSESLYSAHGTRACRGLISFILHPCTVDFGNRDEFLVTIERCNYSFIFSLPAESTQLKGHWMASLVLHINMAQHIRSRFLGVPWLALEYQLMHRFQSDDYNCLCSMCCEYQLTTSLRSDTQLSFDGRSCTDHDARLPCNSQDLASDHESGGSEVDTVKSSDTPGFLPKLFRSLSHRWKTALRRPTRSCSRLFSQRSMDGMASSSDFDASLERNRFWKNELSDTV